MTKFLLPSLYKREELPSLEKRGWGRFCREHVCSNKDPLVGYSPWPNSGENAKAHLGVQGKGREIIGGD
jgi:hypothetical protein